MKIAFGIVTLFGGGGLQRDCMAIARRLAAQGHDVTIFAARRRGERPEELKIELLPNRAFSNHRRDLAFAKAFADATRGRFDRVVGFGKLLDLDVLYCADPCLAAKPAKWTALLSSRRRIQMQLEAASFAAGQHTKCLLLSETQAADFRRAWSTEPGRVVVLPPTIDRNRRKPELRSDGTRERMRAELKVSGDQLTWLAVAAQPKVKGLDRAVAALAAFPNARLVIAGIAEGSKAARLVRGLADKAGVRDRIRLLGLRSDIPELMAAADLLIHPARYDTTGTVILEALVNGLPVITTPQCGYAVHVTAADAGVVLPETFSATDLTEALRRAESPQRRNDWNRNGAAYGEAQPLYDGLDRAAELIVAAG
ncbi:glycosyltransferase family 4 protein [Rhodopseudomonas sp. B29]|uniref:glycosyltransferase family 4 protein n=1 Tax=Rhodopseudomonas sp. B29 TaxID=95607 RepID=UPI00034C5671|nr:glycosyltransferase family 4 protein [Rhodopseudomonas sp. B29]